MADSQFPIVDALLDEPAAGSGGSIAICTNTTATGQVFNEIDEKLRENVAVLGNVIVSRDGAERMILNTVVHPTVKFLVLFSEESLTFSPNTNLLLAVMNGMEDGGDKNIIGGIAASSHYPNINSEILSKFSENVVVLPLHMHKHEESKKVVDDYLVWLKEKGAVTVELIDIMQKANNKGKVYYDVLNQFLAELASIDAGKKEIPDLNPEDFQHLQPPKVQIEGEYKPVKVPFVVTTEGEKVYVKVRLNDKVFGLEGGSTDWDTIVSLAEGILARSTGSDHVIDLQKADGGVCLPEAKNEAETMSYDLKESLTPKEQLLLGVEIGRAHTDAANNTTTPSFVISEDLNVDVELDLLAPGDLDVDDEFYYKLGIKDDEISVMAMALDVCEAVYDFRGKDGLVILNKIAELNRFKKYKYDILHRMDVGTQISRVHIAYSNDFMFIQDFPSIFKVNTTKLPLIVVENDTFLAAHSQLIKRLYSEGLEEEHADARKGMARTGICFAIYRDSEVALEKMAKIYQQGAITTKEIRSDYKKQLLRKDHDGDYSYGQRTRSHFGFDQLEEVKKALTKNPGKTALVTRFDPLVDMSFEVNPSTGLNEFTHDPCLVNDIYFVNNGKLHSLHIARAHNTVNAYPENIFGLYDAYVVPIKDELKLESGDFYMLSNRANILMLTEDQRTKTIMREPVKPNSYEYTTESGPLLMSKAKEAEAGKLSYKILKKIKPGKANRYISRLESYKGVNTIKKATDYLNLKGLSHNNPVLQTYIPGEDDIQSDQLGFFQANVFGGKVYSTAVFTNCENEVEAEDAANYIAKQFSDDLKTPHGELYIFYV